MSERKTWTKEEDEVLQALVTKYPDLKWSVVANMMKEQHNIGGRTGKQCRQRWFNQLNPQIKNGRWTEDEEQLLFRLHDEHGNKWSDIAKHLPGRTDNFIKNHFYSTLRKSIRRLNKHISQAKVKGQLRQIKPLMLSKIVILSGSSHKNPPESLRENINTSIRLKKRLIAFAKVCQDKNVDKQHMVEIIRDILEFNTCYKRRTYPEKTKRSLNRKIEPSQTVQLKLPEKPAAKAVIIPTPIKVEAQPVPNIVIPEKLSTTPKPKEDEIAPVLIVQPFLPPQTKVSNQYHISSSLQSFMNNEHLNAGCGIYSLSSSFTQSKKPIELDLNLPFITSDTTKSIQNPIELSFSFGTTNPAQIWEGQADLQKLTKKAD